MMEKLLPCALLKLKLEFNVFKLYVIGEKNANVNVDLKHCSGDFFGYYV